MTETGNPVIDRIRRQLFASQDTGYREFYMKLIPSVCADRIIGVRTPVLRRMAVSVAQESGISLFLDSLPHFYYEENNLHAFLLERIRSFDDCLSGTERFLPYIDNWSTCDMFFPKTFRNYPEKLLCFVERWICDSHPYTIRYGIGVLMRLYLTDLFRPEYPALVASVSSDEYYVRMMQAWYFATALSFQPDAVMPYLETRRFEPWLHNKIIQKAVESYRIPEDVKTSLKLLRINRKKDSFIFD